MTLRVLRLDDHEASAPPLPPTSIAARLQLLAELSEQSWKLGGKPIPDVQRAQMTAVLRPLGAPPV